MKGLVGIVCLLLGVMQLAAAEEAAIQSHRAPERGCDEFVHHFGGVQYRVYACDGATGPCIFAPHVQVCPTAALLHRPARNWNVLIRSRTHLVRFYNPIGESCYFSILQNCCLQGNAGVAPPTPFNGKRKRSVAEEFDEVKEQKEECKSLTLPTGEKIYDPLECAPKGEVVEMESKKSRKEQIIEALKKLLGID